MDIAFQLPSVSSSAIAKMETLGLDWTSEADPAPVLRPRRRGILRPRPAGRAQNTTGRSRCSSIPAISAAAWREHYRKHYSHLEIESLPTAGWGYDHFRFRPAMPIRSACPSSA